MSRRIKIISYEGAAADGQADGYFDRIVKYIPGDVVAGWVAISGLIASQVSIDTNASTIYWIAFAAGLILSALWTWRQTTGPGESPAVLQIIMAVLAFTVWVFALGGPFATLGFYQPYYGSVLLVLFTVASGVVIPKS